MSGEWPISLIGRSDNVDGLLNGGGSGGSGDSPSRENSGMTVGSQIGIVAEGSLIMGPPDNCWRDPSIGGHMQVQFGAQIHLSSSSSTVTFRFFRFKNGHWRLAPPVRFLCRICREVGRCLMH